MLDKRELLSILKFSKEHQVPVSVESANEKTFTIQAEDINGDMVIYRFTNGNEGRIYLSNIRDCKFIHSKDNDRYHIWAAERYCSSGDLKERVGHYHLYFNEIISKMQEQKKEEAEFGGYYEFRSSKLEEIFKGLFIRRDNLLLTYLSGDRSHLTEGAMSSDVILLLQQSNLSQKRAIAAALENRISVIEGPPGTGKTTTILSVIANMVYQKQKVLVVSKNNSAIDNVAEELEKMDLPRFFIRMGNDKIMSALGDGLIQRLEQYEKAIDSSMLPVAEDERTAMKETAHKLSDLEEELNRLVLWDNELSELKNEMRHLKKRRDAYAFDRNSVIRKKIRSARSAKRNLDFLTGLSIRLNETGKLHFFDQAALLVRFRETGARFISDGILQILSLEEIYLEQRIGELEKTLEGRNLKDLKEQIERIYLEEYIPLSFKLILSALMVHRPEQFTELYEAIHKTEKDTGIQNAAKAVKGKLMDLYPVVLTTVDSVLSNYSAEIKNGLTVDCLIIDEASQCDILSGLPLLYLAKRIVIVGDCRQLDAIKKLKSDEIETKVDEAWDYIKQSFLSSVLKALNPASNMLMEHYRCDYNIINYCNKYFYDNKLIIYKETSGQSMVLVNDDKGKYMEREESSFYNSREIVTIRQMAGDDESGKFMITPFKSQANKLADQFGENQCGTIHSFQGKGEKEVFFTTVLNDTQEAVNHLSGDHNLFGKELMNVAVSRAKNRFVMVTDVDFFKKNDKNAGDLIEYIEAYGTRIPDKTVCLFDYLYKQMPYYQRTEEFDNIFEEEMAKFIFEFLQGQPLFNVYIKLLLAAVVTDKDFLEGHADIKRYILNGAHLDYTIYDVRINRPVLVIELDGKYHKEEKQAERDKKKEAALDHMGIPLWRVGSKEAWEEEPFRRKLCGYLNLSPETEPNQE